jgi:hypothetical protein
MTPRTALLAALPLAPLLAFAGEAKESRLCRAIGETKNISLQPRDRVFFEDRCACFKDTCVAKGTLEWKCYAATETLIWPPPETNLVHCSKYSYSKHLGVDTDLTYAECEELRGQIEGDEKLNLARHFADMKARKDYCYSGKDPKRLVAALTKVSVERAKEDAARTAERQRVADDKKRTKELAQQARLQEQNEKLPGLQAEIIAACKAFRACMNSPETRTCWADAGPGARYEAACRDFVGLAGSAPFLCTNKSNDACSW